VNTPVDSVRPRRRTLGAALVLTLGLACAMLWAGPASAAGHMSSMSSMVGDSDAMAMVAMNGSTAADSQPAAVPEAPESHLGRALAEVYGMPCVSEITDACTGAAGLTVTSVLAFLLIRRRDTFLGLLARHRVPSARRVHEASTPWTVLPLSRSSVLRV